MGSLSAPFAARQTGPMDTETDLWFAASIVVISLDFRCPPVASYPGSLVDINYATRWVKANAARFKTRPELDSPDVQYQFLAGSAPRGGDPGGGGDPEGGGDRARTGGERSGGEAAPVAEAAAGRQHDEGRFRNQQLVMRMDVIEFLLDRSAGRMAVDALKRCDVGDAVRIGRRVHACSLKIRVWWCRQWLPALPSSGVCRDTT